MSIIDEYQIQLRRNLGLPDDDDYDVENSMEYVIFKKAGPPLPTSSGLDGIFSSSLEEDKMLETMDQKLWHEMTWKWLLSCTLQRDNLMVVEQHRWICPPRSCMIAVSYQGSNWYIDWNRETLHWSLRIGKKMEDCIRPDLMRLTSFDHIVAREIIDCYDEKNQFIQHNGNTYRLEKIDRSIFLLCELDNLNIGLQSDQKSKYSYFKDSSSREIIWKPINYLFERFKRINEMTIVMNQLDFISELCVFIGYYI